MSKQSTAQNGISPKDAAQKAAQFLRDVTQIAGELSIEEVQKEDDGSWLITLGYHTPNPFGILGGPKEYKLFKVNATTGEVISMRMR